MKYLIVSAILGAAALVSGCGGGERVGKSNAQAPAATEENTDATDENSAYADDDDAQNADAAAGAEAAPAVESDAAAESDAASPDDGDSSAPQ